MIDGDKQIESEKRGLNVKCCIYEDLIKNEV